MKKQLILGTTAIVASLSIAAPAGALTPPLSVATQAEASAAQTFLRDNGVSPLTVSNLMASFKRGEPIGSAAGLAVTSEETVREGDLIVTTETYQDGSVEVSTVEQPLADDGISDSDFEKDGDILFPDSVTAYDAVAPDEVDSQGSIVGCKVHSGSGYRSYSNCTMRRRSVTANIFVQVSYTLVKRGNDYISKIGRPSHRCYAATCSGKFSKIVRKRETRSGQALAQAGMNVDLYKSFASKSFWVNLKVGKNSAKIQNAG